MRSCWALVLIAATCGAAYAETADTFGECLNKDSISCIQLMVYRTARDVFSKKSIELFGGISFEKPDRSAKSSEALVAEQQVEAAKDIESRNGAIQNYVVNGISGFFQERSLNLNFANTVRSLMNAIPQELKTGVSDLVSEGRGKKKKLLKSLLPILIAVKLKLAVLAVLAVFGIALLAKKALLVSVIALAISAFLGLKKLLASKSGGHHVEEISAYHGGGGGGGWSPPSGWASGGGGGGGGGGWDSGSGGHDAHGSYSSPIAQQLAYSGHTKTS